MSEIRMETGNPVVVEVGVTIEPLSLAPADMDYAVAIKYHQELVDYILSCNVSREQFEASKGNYSSLFADKRIGKSLAFTSSEELQKRSNDQLSLDCCLSTVVTPCNPDDLLVDTPIIVEGRK